MQISHLKLGMILPCFALLFSISFGGVSLLASEKSEIDALLDSYDKLWIDKQTYAELEMKVKTANFERELKMNYWGKGPEKSLVRITYPPKENGVSTLKSGKDVYNFIPKTARTTKITDALLSQSWMGSHFSNSDLMRTTSIRRDYDVKLEQKKGKGDNEVWILEATAKPEVATLQKRLLLYFNRKLKLPTEQKIYDKSNRLLRTFVYLDVKNYSGKLVPSKVRVTPETSDLKGEFTEVVYAKIERNKKISDEIFSISNLTEL